MSECTGLGAAGQVAPQEAGAVIGVVRIQPRLAGSLDILAAPAGRRAGTQGIKLARSSSRALGTLTEMQCTA